MLTQMPVPHQIKLQLAAHNYAHMHTQQQPQHPPAAAAHIGLTSSTVHGSQSTEQSAHSAPEVLSNGQDHNLHDAPTDYYVDLLRSHRAVNLLRSISTSDGDTAWGLASLAPIKDMEILVLGSHMCSQAFQRMLYAALRAMIDDLSVQTFNVGMLNVDLGVKHEQQQQQSQQQQHGAANGDVRAGDLSGTQPDSSANTHAGCDHAIQVHVPDALAAPPVIARLVSRGKLSVAASDYGGLEVFGGACIGHTDPFRVIAALDLQL